MSLEYIQLPSFPAYAQNSTKTNNLQGVFPLGYEVHSLEVVFEINVSINASTGSIVAADHLTIANALLSKLRFSAYGQNDVYNLTPAENRVIATAALWRDPWTESLRVGQGTTVTPTAFKLKFEIPFIHRGLDYPEMFAPYSDQLNLAGTKLDLDTGSASLTTISIGGGASTVTVTDVKLFMTGVPVAVPHCAPAMYWRSKAISQNIDVEYGPALDIFVADERAFATTEVQVQTYEVVRDGRSGPKNISPTNLALQYQRFHGTQDGTLPLDITNNTTGTQMTPFIFLNGVIRSTEWQLPFYMQNRTVRQNLASGGSPNATFLFWQVRPINEVQVQMINLAASNGIQISSLDQLIVRGGGSADNDVNKLFKGRFIALRG